MRRLSQKAWNNVLIFSMLGLIVIFNWERLFPSDMPTRLPLLPENSVVLTLQIDQVVFERVGSTWRINSNREKLAITSDDIQQLIDSWNKATMRLPKEKVETADLFPQDHVVSVFIAGQKNGLVFSFKQLEDTVYIIHDEHYFELDFPLLSQLIPSQLALTQVDE